MKAIAKTAMAALALVLFGTLWTLPASAGCSPYTVPKSGAHLQKQSWDGNFPGASLRLVSSTNTEPIVGFWSIVLSIDGQAIDSGYAQWHDDGTEMMNSSRSPATQSFCMGVWKKVARNTYKLNHFALSFNPDGSEVGPANIRQLVTVKNGNSYSGSFTLDQYDLSGNLLVHLEGDVSGTRITPDTPPSKLN